MPYPMIHMETAYRLLERYDWIEEKGDFILGSVAPDAVHFHEPYDYRIKEVSHLWDGCGPKWGVTLDSPKWKDNIRRFWEQRRDAENRDFLAGYCVHLLTDWLNNRRMWAPFRIRIVQGEDYDKVYAQSAYREEAYGFDQWLHQTSAHTEEIWKLLAEGHVYGIDGYILKEDLARQKTSLLTEQYADKKPYDISAYKHYTEEVIMSYIEECIDVIGEVIF
ncbi:MAG: hypothetical protein NC318_07165 [Blautia sp.]|nr:hypothetical protein [Blautia sp.]